MDLVHLGPREEAILADYVAGMGWKQLAAKHKVSARTISAIRFVADATGRHASTAARRKALAAYKMGYKITSIVETLGVSQGTLNRDRIRAGVPSRTRAEYARRKAKT